MELPLTIGDRLGEVALGAGPGQVAIGDSTTVCFYKLASAALDLRPGRDQIVTDYDNFPTDRYALEGLAQARGLDLVSCAATRTEALSPRRWPRRWASGPRWSRSRTCPTARLTSPTWRRSAGSPTMPARSLCGISATPPGRSRPRSMPTARTWPWGAPTSTSTAVPGAPAFLYARRALQPQLRQPIWGWLGRRDPFEMADGYVPAAGIRGLLSGTPPVLALSAVDEGVALVAEAGIERIRAKGIALTELASLWAPPYGRRPLDQPEQAVPDSAAGALDGSREDAESPGADKKSRRPTRRPSPVARFRARHRRGDPRPRRSRRFRARAVRRRDRGAPARPLSRPRAPRAARRVLGASETRRRRRAPFPRGARSAHRGARQRKRDSQAARGQRCARRPARVPPTARAPRPARSRPPCLPDRGPARGARSAPASARADRGRGSSARAP